MMKTGASQGPTARVAPPRQRAVTMTSGRPISSDIQNRTCPKLTFSLTRQVSSATAAANQSSSVPTSRRRRQRSMTAITGTTGQA
jgi:hypothetical protein